MPLLLLMNRRIYRAYLLIYGVLPTKAQFKIFESEIMHHSVMHADAVGFFHSFRCVHSVLYLAHCLRSLQATMHILWLSSQVLLRIWGHTTAKPTLLSKARLTDI
jgi:citrate synthase